jgi:arylsulfatase A-like enzyme
VVLPAVKIGDNVPLQALKRQNEKIWGMDALQQRKTISAYMASVRFMDQQIGRLMDALERLDLKDETIVIFLSDHGYNLGEHDCWSKVSLWEGSVRVPLIISVPGKEYQKTHGSTSETIAELLDLYPTLADLAGFTAEKPNILQGKSLMPQIKGNTLAPEGKVAYTINNGGASLRTDRYRYTRWGTSKLTDNEELYDHTTDPEELNNLAGDVKQKAVLEDLRKKLDEVRNKARSEIKNAEIQE